MKRYFFTLTELLVVIAIIAILTSILLPALGKARASGQRIVCSGNQKQIGLALKMYENDFSLLPPAQQLTYTTAGSWDSVLLDNNYLKGGKVFFCLSDTVVRDDKTRTPRTYAANGYIMPDLNDSACVSINGQLLGKLSGATKSLSKIVLLMERPTYNTQYTRNFSSNYAFGPSSQSGSVTGNCDTNYPHKTGANYLFCDGHVNFINYLKGPNFQSAYCYPK